MTRYNQQRKLEAEKKRDADLKKQKEYEEKRRKELEKEEMEALLDDPEEAKRKKDKSIRWIYETPAGFLSDQKKEQTDTTDASQAQTTDQQETQKAGEKQRPKKITQMDQITKKFDFLQGMPKSKFGEDDPVLRYYPLGRLVCFIHCYNLLTLIFSI